MRGNFFFFLKKTYHRIHDTFVYNSWNSYYLQCHDMRRWVVMYIFCRRDPRRIRPTLNNNNVTFGFWWNLRPYGSVELYDGGNCDPSWYTPRTMHCPVRVVIILCWRNHWCTYNSSRTDVTCSQRIRYVISLRLYTTHATGQRSRLGRSSVTNNKNTNNSYNTCARSGKRE
jgi:hypothetical protein